MGNAYSRWFLQSLVPLRVALGPDGFLNTVAPVFGEVVTVSRSLGCYRLHGNNIWSSGGDDLDRLRQRIEHRLVELQAMRELARARGLPVADVNALNYELPFINYRLAALRLGEPYAGSDTDHPLRLLVVRRPLSGLPPYARAGIGIGHALWFTLLLVVPRPWVRPAVRWQFFSSAAEKGRSRVQEPPRKSSVSRFATDLQGQIRAHRKDDDIADRLSFARVATEGCASKVPPSANSRREWSLVESQVGMAVLSAAVLVVFARYLYRPEAFGLFAIVLALVEVLSVVVGMLFHDALIQVPNAGQRHLDSAFTVYRFFSAWCCWDSSGWQVQRSIP